MAEKRDRRPRNEEPPELIDDEDVRGGEDQDQDDEFEDVESEDEDLDEDIVDEEAKGEDRHFTGEIGSEGGSAGSIEERRAQSGISRGSEATETGRPSANRWLPRERKRTNVGPEA